MLYLDRNLILESSCGLKEAEYVLLGVPFDSTSTYRAGSREAPYEIRREFHELEKNTFHGKRFHDLGNVEAVHGSLQKTFGRIRDSLDFLENVNPKARIIALGGEHTLTYPLVERLSEKHPRLHVIQLDAHMDLKKEYNGEKWCHATFMRHLAESSGIELTQVGVRSASQDELDYARKIRIRYCGTNRKDIGQTIGKLKNKTIYLTLDMDVLDPNIAPAVGNPEPNGLGLNTLNAIISKIAAGNKIAGFDLTEVCPPYDHKHTTTLTAAKIMLDFVEKTGGGKII